VHLMIHLRPLAEVLGCAAVFTVLFAAAQAPPRVLPSASDSAQSTLHVESFDIPFSSFASPEARRKAAHMLRPANPPNADDISNVRAFYARFSDQQAARMKLMYPVNIETQTIAGVKTEIITPKEGVATKNRRRVLINLHGGGFMWGEGSGAEVESIPIASLGKIEVITVFYRLAPENNFPAASEDVAAVYKSLLAKYPPANIGIYGCSAGGVLTAEAMAWFDKVHLPLPGAIGTLCGSIAPFDGDSAYIAPLLDGVKGQPAPLTMASLPYFRGADPHDPLVFPINSPSLLAKFPPTLLIAGSRDFAFSSLLKTQAVLTDANVEADLHVWDGMWHAFFVDPDLPESREVYDVITRFFDRHLGVK